LGSLQAPQAAPPAGYFYAELITDPVVVTNFRGIFNDHISAQNSAESGDVIHLPKSTALIVGVGGIGAETARFAFFAFRQ
jgi:hypothetical protein